MPELDSANQNDAGSADGTDGANGNDSAAKAEKTFTQADVDRMIQDRLRRFSDYGDLKRFKESAMTDQEKAIAEAEAKGRKEAVAQSGVRLAKAEIKAAAAGKVAADQIDGFLEYADLTKFIGDDGEPDTKAIEAAVKRLAPTPGRTNFDGGARTTSQGKSDMNALIRKSAGFSA